MKKILILAFLTLAVITTANAQKENTKKRFVISSIKKTGTFADWHYDYSYDDKGQLIGVSFTGASEINNTSYGKAAVSYDDRGNVSKFEYTTVIEDGKTESGYTEFLHDRDGNVKLIRKIVYKDGKPVVMEEERRSYDKNGLVREAMVSRMDKPFSHTVFKYDENGSKICEVITAQDTAVGLYPWGSPQKIERFYDCDENGEWIGMTEKNDGKLYWTMRFAKNIKKNYENNVVTYFTLKSGKKSSAVFTRDYYNDDKDIIRSLFKQKDMGINQKTTYTYDNESAAEVVDFNPTLRECHYEFFPMHEHPEGHRLISMKKTGKFFIMVKSQKGTEETFFEYKEL